MTLKHFKKENNNNYTLFNATTNGVLRCFNMLIDSIVWGSKPCVISTTKIATSQREEPRDLRLLEEKNIYINISTLLG